MRKAPRPEDSDGGRVEAEEVPVNGDAEYSCPASFVCSENWSGDAHISILKVKTVANLAVNLARIIFPDAAEGEAGAEELTPNS
jgi:hypothetical protein